MGKLYMQSSVRDTICMSFIYSDGGNVCVFDGGYPFESENLYERIKNAGGEIHTWFLTHPHDDHIGAFCALMEEHGDEIKVHNLCFNFISRSLMEEYAMHDAQHSIPLLDKIDAIIKKYGINVITPALHDVYQIGNYSVKVLHVPNPSITRELFNNSSVVYRLDTENARILFLGDLTTEGGVELTEQNSADELHCDYVQMAHHGQGGVEKDVYQTISPKYCLWCTPTWLWNNMGEGGYDTGFYKTVIVRGWMSELHMKKHYLFHNGNLEIDI